MYRSKLEKGKCLRRQILKDLKERKKPPKITAFNQSVPKEMRFVPSKVNPKVWLKYEGDKDHLASMSAVWKGITHLRSTRMFCQWLMEDPVLPRPKYLEDEGMLVPEFYNKPHYSIQSQVSAGFGQPVDVFSDMAGMREEQKLAETVSGTD